jgi:hypothetical protein
MNTSKRHWVAVTLAAALAALAAGIPTAGADPWWNDEQVSITRPDDRTGMRGAGAVASAGLVESIGRPDDQPGPRGPGTVSSERPAIVTSFADALDWLDAGIGAAFAAGLLAIGAGALLVVRRRGDSTSAAA